MQALSVVTTENWSACLGHYRRRGDTLLTSAAARRRTFTHYDTNGNLLNKKRYAYVPNGGTLGACLETISYGYDAAGNVVAVEVQSDSWYIDGETLYYIRNGQGDIMGLIDSSGRTVIEYRYDTWGKDCSYQPEYQEYLDLQELNPFRYRGYVYDTETGWYYLQSRYYDPEVCRFINADVYLSTGQGVLGHNTFAYCLNNPVNMSDPSGYCPTYVPGCPFCKANAYAALIAQAIYSYCSLDLDIEKSDKTAYVIYYWFDDTKQPLVDQATMNGLSAYYATWDYEGHAVKTFQDFQNKWNEIPSGVDDVYIFVHSNTEGFRLGKPANTYYDFSGLKELDINGNVYLLSCHAGYFAEDLAAQTNTSVYATNSAVNYSTNPLTGALYPRRSFWDRFFGRNDWQVYGGNE